MAPGPRERGRQLVQTASPATALFGSVFMIPGIYVLLLGLNVIHAAPGSIHCPMFVLIGVGIAFTFAGLSCILQAIGLQRTWLGNIVGLGMVVGLLTPFFWIVFLNNQIGIFTKLFFMFIMGVFVLFGLVVMFARFIPGVRVIKGGEGETLKSISRSDDKF